jgi:hypothetical protein
MARIRSALRTSSFPAILPELRLRAGRERDGEASVQSA